MPGAGMASAVELYEKLKKEWSGSGDVHKCEAYLNQLKLALLELSFLPTGNKPAQAEILLARNVLELGAQVSIKREDIPAFERYMAQLKTYYFDYSEELPESPYQYQILGLNLLRLLSQNRIAEFHSELELLDPSLLHENIYLKHPVALEQHLMEGSYNKVFLARGNVPAASYLFFINILMGTIREEIANCSERSYSRLPVEDARGLLFLDSAKDVEAFAAAREWRMEKGAFVFDVDEQRTVEIPARELIHRSLHYAQELEKIV